MGSMGSPDNDKQNKQFSMDREKISLGNELVDMREPAEANTNNNIISMIIPLNFHSHLTGKCRNDIFNFKQEEILRAMSKNS